MTSFDEAVAAVRELARPLGTETLPIAVAAGRVLAEAVHARVDSPPADVSAMDGYAVRDEDVTTLPASLTVAGESFAGRGWDGEVALGQCVRIFTGAPVPRGADRVIIQENVDREGDKAIIREFSGTARHIRPRGGDFAQGDELLSAGQYLHPRAVVAAAAADLAELRLFVRPRVAVLSTGDELASPGSAAAVPGAIPESVSFGVAALVEQWGGTIAGRSLLRDDLAAMERAAAEAVETADLVIVTGGASVGEKDFAKTMFEPLGLELMFSKVAIKPGKPVWLGKAGATLVMGLPGNPTSALVTGRLLLAPLLCGLTGRDAADALRWLAAPLGAGIGPCGARETFHRARWDDGAVEVLSNQDSSAQKTLAEADVLVRQRAHAPAVPEGGVVEILDF